MFRIICVTDRKLCSGDFFARLAEICAGGADFVILREKDLAAAEYAEVAGRALAICGPRLVLHGAAALPLLRRVPRVHLPLAVLESKPEIRKNAELLGVSVHSAEEAKRAQKLGADYVTAGHIFETACKSGLPGRGLSFLRDTASSVNIPVYAIGGVSARNIAAVRGAGGAGACVMSGLMSCASPKDTLAELRRAAG
ncbi:thiamine phosphate synthase [Cloacibacillus sp. An23]|uniref:thiamine phosphate synthase n=1 Tax=Cloacibacillus sp. An23 TaxID=1965591 RepID=UPI000B36CB3D|nr:thiamine phosphate synthase [Cloacibacillus sp. An23]OUO95115.1 hypothetical protein B5F39_00880 [Cloacibacillus sp. An23]